ncbi:hypothetical protein BC833DRAFT_611830 [Globomyces pollinis-pini]|nr:hypothetical protein BC833DRAFT_611830 [Globomyces pollinis-pini]
MESYCQKIAMAVEKVQKIAKRVNQFPKMIKRSSQKLFYTMYSKIVGVACGTRLTLSQKLIV